MGVPMLRGCSTAAGAGIADPAAAERAPWTMGQLADNVVTQVVLKLHAGSPSFL